MNGSTQQSVLHMLLVLSVITLTRCALLEMSQILWNKTVAGGMTKIGRLDPLRVPLIKVDQSEGDANYRVILRNLEIVGLNGSVLESIHIARGELKSNLSELQAGYVSYSDLRDVDAIKYRFHTVMREPSTPRQSFEAIVSPINRAVDVRPSSRYQDARFDRLQQDQHRSKTFEQSRQYEQQIPYQPDVTSNVFYRGNLRTTSNFHANPAGNNDNVKRPAYIQPIYTQRTKSSQGYHGSSQKNEDTIDCDNTKLSQFNGNQGNRQYDRQSVNAGYYGERVGDTEISASETVETRLKNQGGVTPTLYNGEQSRRSNVASSGNVKSSRNGMIERSGFIDIVYAGNKTNSSVKHFGNLGTDLRENRRVYGIDDVMKNIRENTKFFIYNFTEGEALKKRNDIVKAAIEAKRLKDLIRYAKNYQEQQGYFEEGMQLIYHYGGIDVKNDSISQQNLNDTRRTKRAHPEETFDDDVMHVILRIRVPLLQVKSQYTLMGKVGKEMLRGNGLLTGNFTDVVGDFTLELKKINEELIVRTAKAKLFAKDKKVNFQDINEEGPMQAILKHGLMAAEAVAAMLADDFATKGLSERTADALIYRMYKDLPVN